ncbi:MAG: hypothetical protein ACRD9R_09770 [Pyrinomonadaceae bacterium]
MKSKKLIAAALSLFVLTSGAWLEAAAQTKGARRPAGATAPAQQPKRNTEDIKVRARSSFGDGGQSFEDVQYVKGARERRESQGGYISLMQCDLKRSLMLNTQAQTYLLQPFGAADGEEESTATAANTTAPAAGTSPGQMRRGGVVTYVSTSTDTGERKQMFGFTARRIKTTMVSEASPDACQQDQTKTETDGWYIDLDYAVDCQAQQQTPQTTQSPNAPQCRDRIKFKQVGTARLGFPVDMTYTSYQPDGTKTSFRREVIELTRGPLDQSLFEIPAGYTEAKDFQQLAGVNTQALSGGRDDDDEDNDSDNKSSPPQNSPAATAQGAPAADTLGPKRVGVTRIGVPLPAAQSKREGANTAGLAEALRGAIAERLNGPNVEVVALNAADASQIEPEARRKECDFVLYASIAQKPGGGGGGFGGFLKKAAPIADVLPVTGVARSTAGAVASTVVTTAVYAAGNVKAKDEFTADYRLIAPGGVAPKVADTVKAKAKSDGDDVVASLAAQIAAAVSGVVK